MPLRGFRGAGSEVWNRVYMIAPVKKFGRVRLSTIFLQNKYGGECRHGGTMSFCSVLSFPASKHQEKVFKNIFKWNFWTSGGVMYEQFMDDYTQRDSASRQVQLFISFVNFRATSLVSISYIFPPTVVLRTLFLILNTCYELTILVHGLATVIWE